MGITTGEGPDGKPTAIKADDDGRLEVAASITAQDGPIEVVIAAPQTATALPEPGTEGLVVHAAPTGVRTADESVSVVIASDQPELTVTTFERTRAKPGHPGGFVSSTAVGTSEALDVNPVALAPDAATETKQDDTITAIASLEVEVSDDATEATAASTLAAVDTLEANTDQIESKLGTLAAQEATTSAINTKLLAALGTAFAVPVRATATNVAAQLPNASYGRGFVVENIDTANDLYVGPSNAVTTSNGFRISPSRSRRFDLPNSNLLWVISASTTAYQIGATT